jgi:hypothetical protein
MQEEEKNGLVNANIAESVPAELKLTRNYKYVEQKLLDFYRVMPGECEKEIIEQRPCNPTGHIQYCRQLMPSLKRLRRPIKFL